MLKSRSNVLRKGSISPSLAIYPFFLIHMLAFGASGFYMAYSGSKPPLDFLYMHGGFAIFIYIIFYLVIFGVDEIKWMFINAALGIFGIYSQIDWILSLFGRKVEEFSWFVHAVPFLYFILYTFLIRQMILDITKSRDDKKKKRFVEYSYVFATIGIYLIL